MSMRYPGGLIATSPVNARYPSGVWTQAQAAPYQAQNVWTRDQFWPNTTLLLQGDGATNGAQNNTFLDSSSNAFTITRNGNTTQGSFTPYEQDGYWSNYFDGNGDYLSAASNAAFAPGTNDFTIECWVNLSSIGTYNGFFQNTNSTSSAISDKFFFAQYNNLLVLYTHSGGSAAASTPWTPSIGVWYHVAAVRQSGTIKLFINGVQQTVTGSTTFNGYSLGQAGISIGMTTTPFYFNGYISNLRYVVGTAVYTASFTLPTAPTATVANTQILTCQSNRFIDNSGNAYALTVNGDTSVQAFQPFPGATTYSGTVLGGSGYFDGSGDYLTVPSNTAFAFNGAYTVEFWLFPLVQYGSSSVVGFVCESTTGGFVCAIDNSSRGITIGARGVSNQITTGAYPTANTWNHIVVCRDSSNNTSVYLNGTRIGTASLSTSYTSSGGTVEIGTLATTTYPFTGYMSNLRIVKGTAVYDPTQTTITVPTAPVTAITNTSLLTNFTNAGIYDNSMMNNLETVGNAQVSTSVVKYGTGSMAFDGSGDYLVSRASTNNLYAFGTGDFTIEFWLYLNSTGQQIIWDGRPGSTTPTIYYFNSALRYYTNAADQIVGSSLATGQWYHIAISRSGTSTRMFINGTQSGSTYSDSTNYTTSTPIIGADANSGSFNNNLNGYIDDFRITRAARYLTTFTPPPARMPGQ